MLRIWNTRGAAGAPGYRGRPVATRQRESARAGSLARPDPPAAALPQRRRRQPRGAQGRPARPGTARKRPGPTRKPPLCRRLRLPRAAGSPRRPRPGSHGAQKTPDPEDNVRLARVAVPRLKKRSQSAKETIHLFCCFIKNMNSLFLSKNQCLLVPTLRRRTPIAGEFREKEHAPG